MGEYTFDQLHVAMLGENTNNLLSRRNIVSRYRPNSDLADGAGLSFVQADPMLAEEMTHQVARLFQSSQEKLISLHTGYE